MCVVVILALGGLKEVEMCCEGPEAVATWAPSLLAAGPPQAAPPLPWVVESVSPLTQEGRRAWRAEPGRAWLAWLSSCLDLLLLSGFHAAHGDGLTHFL